MYPPEVKKCQRCGNSLACNAQNIEACACSQIILSPQQRAYIAAQFHECLCNNCLTEIKSRCPDEQEINNC